MLRVSAIAMMRCVEIVLMAFLALTTTTVLAKTALEPQFTPLHPLEKLPGRELVDFISRERYDLALALADSMIEADPKSIEGHFFKLTALNNRIIDYEDQSDLLEMMAVADSVVSRCERRIEFGDSSAIVRLYRGSAEGFSMIHDLREGNYIDAIIHGTRAAGWLEDAVRRDSTCYDAYVGLGNYYYYKSRHSGVLIKTGIVSDRTEEGLRMLKFGAEHGLLTSLAAKSSLAWIAIDQEKYDEAQQIARELLALYPGNRAFLWCLGRAQMKAEHWNDALLTYEQILLSVRSLPANNHYNEISALHSLAKASARLGEWGRVKDYADRALALRPDQRIAKKKAADLERLEKLRAKAMKELTRNNSK